MVNLCLKSNTFRLYFIPFSHVWIRIRINTKILNRDLIRIHNTALENKIFAVALDPDILPPSLWFCFLAGVVRGVAAARFATFLQPPPPPPAT